MTSRATVHLITYSNELVNGEAIYVSSNSLPIKSTRFEPAGHSFHDVALKLRGYYEEENVPGDDENLPKDKENDYMQSSDSYSSKGKKKSGDKTAQQDHYALLGLGHLRYLATEEQIRKSYRETALRHHPDKQAALLLGEETEAAKQAKKDEIENHFKAIQEAYEVLMDPTRRRIYDSTDEFDDEIPTDCSPQDFFKVFGPAFMRNGRWSVSQPIPMLGDDNTPLKEVDAFYDFWFAFKSWREFPHEDEYDLEQAESRDHKRWMERQNAKLSEKARKEEHVRIRSLVDNAYKRDPRILRRKETLKAEKQKKKEAKFMAKKQQEEEAARIAEENRRKKEEEDRLAAVAASNQKKQKEKEKKLLRKERTRLRTVSTAVVSDNSLNISQDDVENLCMSLDMLQLQNLCDGMERREGDSQSQAELLKQAISSDHVEKDHATKNSQQNGSAKVKVNGSVSTSSFEKKEKEKPWGKEEIELLRKGIVKYPKGTSRRWEVISEYIGTGRSVEEILKATKTVLLQKPDNAKAFDSFLEKRKPTVTISSPLTTREEVVGTSSTVTPTPAQPDVVPVPPKPSQAAEKVEPVGSSSDPDAWSAVQETALVQALKTFPKETNQRWERVAAAVPGKTVNQCKKQFALLKEKFRNKKSNQSG
ncbi:putative transcription factor MYB/SANT family [Helianthus debilis subsp. tardiflorus]